MDKKGKIYQEKHLVVSKPANVGFLQVHLVQLIFLSLFFISGSF